MNIAPGWLISGGQSNLVKDSLVPRPDSAPSLQYGVGMQFFIVDQLALHLDYQKGFVNASAENQKPLNLYEFTMFRPGLSFRYLFKPSGTKYGLDFTAGAIIGTLDYRDAFKELVVAAANAQRVSVTFKGNAKGVGYFFRVNFRMYLTTYVFLAMGLEGQHLRVTFRDETRLFDGVYLSMPFSAGFGF